MLGSKTDGKAQAAQETWTLDPPITKQTPYHLRHHHAALGWWPRLSQGSPSLGEVRTGLVALQIPRVPCYRSGREFLGIRQLLLLIYMATAGGSPESPSGMVVKNAGMTIPAAQWGKSRFNANKWKSHNLSLMFSWGDICKNVYFFRYGDCYHFSRTCIRKKAIT